MRWEYTTLGEYFLKNKGLIQTGPFGSQLHQSDYKEEGIPVIMPKDILQNRVNTDTTARINEQDKNRLKKHIVKEKDIVFPRRGEITKRAFITTNEIGFLCGTGCILIRNYSSNLSSKFLNYFLADKKTIDWLESNAVGSTMKNLSGGILKKLPISIPPFSTQQKIVSILSAYDYLIENNLKRIKLLEEAAQNLYNEWFVNFRFPGSENTTINKGTGLPEGWEKKPVDEVFDINIGKTPPRKETHWFSHNEGIKWVSISDMNKSGIFITNTKEYITQEGVEKYKVKVVKKGTVFLSFKLTIGSVGIATEDMTTNEAIAHFNISDETPNTEYTYLYLKIFPYQTLGSTSSIGKALNSKLVKAIPFISPTKKVLEKFENSVKPIFNQISVLINQNEVLKEARDLLLSRLMNRSIEV